MIDAPLWVGKLFGAMIGGALVFLAYLVRLKTRAWLTPASVYCLLWAGFVLMPLIMAPTVPINPLSLIYILAACVAFSVGAAPLPWASAMAANAMKPSASEVFSTPVLRFFFVAITLISFISIGGALAAQGFSWVDLSGNLLATSAKFASMRYAEELTPTLFTQASLLSSYVATALGGFLYSCQSSSRKRLLLAVLSFAPAVMIMVSQSAKGVLFMSFAYFWGAINVCRVYNGEKGLVSVKGLKVAAKAAIVVMPLVAFSFLARGLSGSQEIGDIAEKLRYYFSSYLFAHLYAFSDWFGAYFGYSASLEYVTDGPKFGLYTFYGLFQLFGDPTPLPQGVYDEYFSVDGVFTSNIFTMYRGLLLDFGLIGSLGFMLAAGLVVHIVFFALTGSDRPRFAVSAYVVMTGAFVHSFLSSLLMYNSTYATLVVIWAILVVNDIFSSGKARL